MFPLEQGAFEMLLIGAIALIVVGPKDLPVLMRKVGQFTAKMRGLAAEFRASFDEMARQSELDELRREVEALRTGQPTSAWASGETLHAPAPAVLETTSAEASGPAAGPGEAAALEAPGPGPEATFPIAPELVPCDPHASLVLPGDPHAPPPSASPAAPGPAPRKSRARKPKIAAAPEQKE
jgi:sec-independent protein translocase protein TatB